MIKTITLILFLCSTIYSQVIFDADFESGNLANVTTQDSTTFYVTTKEDIGGRWFYFKISGVKEKFIKVIITNSDVRRAMYSYDNKDFVRFSASESPTRNLFQKTFEEDSVWVSYYTPYTYSFLQERILEWQQSEFVNVDTLGFTPRDFPMQEIILTDFSIPHEEKYHVWIHSRTHPGETPSSWHFDGIVQELLKDNEITDYYRKNIVFYLYPFNNPEGVFYGRSRTNYEGIDQERDWNKLPEETTNAVNMLKNRMKEIMSENPLSIFLNLHSQASSYCTFWIHTPESTSNYFYRKEYQFSNLQASDLSNFKQTDFRESNLKSHFPEGFIWDEYGEEVMALTYETPYDYYSDNTWVTNENLFEIGSRTVHGIAEYLELSPPQKIIIDNVASESTEDWELRSDGLNFYSEDYILTKSENTHDNVIFTTFLESGEYDIYGWWPSSNEYSYNTKFQILVNDNNTMVERSQRSNGGQWNFLSTVNVSSPDNLEIHVSANNTGYVVADAFRIVYKGVSTSVDEGNDLIADNFRLYQNYPNPFNPTTTIKFELNEAAKVKLEVYNSLGQLIEELINQDVAAGFHEVLFSSHSHSSLSSGVYYYRFSTKDYSQTKGMVLLK